MYSADKDIFIPENLYQFNRLCPTEDTMNNIPVPVMCEGIDINDNKREIAYNPNHQDNLDTSVENNPIVDKTIIPGVEVWSIFQRKWSRQGDGNPFIYALKKEKGWHFRRESDRELIEAQINAVADKFLEKSNYNATILIPSSSNVNNYLADILISKASSLQRIDGLLRKLSTQEAEDYALEDGSTFRKVYGANEEQFNFAMGDLRGYLDKMDRLKNGIFTRHLIDDREMRNAMDKTFALNADPENMFAPKINGMDLLIIDDTISRGQSVNEAVSRLKQCYAPKSITVLTLLSKLD